MVDIFMGALWQNIRCDILGMWRNTGAGIFLGYENYSSMR